MGDSVGSVEVGGVERTYTLHVPPLPDPGEGRRPLLVVLHGRNLTLPEMRMITHFDAIADRHGFTIVYPDGYQRTWNDGRGNSAAEAAGMDDVGFIRTLLDHLGTQDGLDLDRVGATGISNGAVMCHRLGLEVGDRISVIAPVSGTMHAALAHTAPDHAVSVLMIHGTSDRFAPFAGGPSLFGGAASLSFSDTAAQWRAIDRCEPEAKGTPLRRTWRDPTSVERTVSSGGVGGTAVEAWTVRRGGHTWPGGPPMAPLGRTSSRFDAGEVIWQFVARHFAPEAQRRRA